MKIVIIGTNHAGIAAANTLLDNYPGHEITMIDRNSNMSYLGCGTALWVGRQIDQPNELFYARPDDFETKGAKVLTETEVSSIDFEHKKVYATTKAGEEHVEDYDKLILAMGSRPIIPKITGNELEGIHFLKLFQEGQAVDEEFAKEEVKRIAVIGAGYIGTEIAEAAKRRGKEVLLFDAETTSLASYYDEDFAKGMDENLENHGVELHFGETAEAFKGTNGRVSQIVTNKGTYDVDMVINCIGFTANSALVGDKLDTLRNGAVKVDKHQQTSNPDVYAVGDVATIYSNALQDFTYIALASNAVRSGIVAGHNIGGTVLESAGVQGSNGISIFGYNMTSTGFSVKAAQKFGLEVAYTDFEDKQKAWFLHENNDTVKIRIVYEKSSRRIVGAQMASYGEIIAGNINMFSLAIQDQKTIDELALLDLFFLPHFNSPYNYMTVAALKAE
ncbi:H2O-forming NADH oxidase [Lactococcus garvieae]|uniref:NADH oxidase n=1 Tax=Lactococcus garvieae (strain Lg2) TaxID=420890 RepID=F9VCS3_LACGL|nr:FAD-dependent oxidoreductase [Lactococcus garvieae]EOT32493.1 NADH oxidase [Lactococcus garvieae ATCC 49156]EOT93803.1 NADH oxidase [Lactococcus garvieae ATCC 49156]QSR00836.1 FAD-dependent oxidoreductase [Lactococcus garvieae]BAK58157.1 NADH oxidase [Lactococcus garvieae ATCC 49156]BAK60124.1 NADH oxidase [Lactococcus garvieae Lg2]